jgi:hypothetical protein
MCLVYVLLMYWLYPFVLCEQQVPIIQHPIYVQMASYDETCSVV